MSWNTFLPAFAATVLGVLLGIPAGLFLNSLLQRARDRELRATQRKRLHEVLIGLKVAIVTNSAALGRLSALGPTTAVFGPNFDLATWQMVQLDVRSLVEPAAYKILFAQYFEDIAELRELIRVRNNFVLGVDSVLDHSGTTRSVLLQLIHDRAGVAREKGGKLLEQFVEINGLLALRAGQVDGPNYSVSNE